MSATLGGVRNAKWISWLVACAVMSGCAATGEGGADGGDGASHGDARDSSANDGVDRGGTMDSNTDTGTLDDSGDTGTTDDATDTPTFMTCDGGGASITGTTYAPNQMDPIPNVGVYTTSDTMAFPPAPNMVTCDRCVSFTGSMGGTRSAADGTFSITGAALDAGGTFTVVMVSGGFRHVIRHVTVPPCGTVSLTAAQTSFSGATSGDDIVPTIAVAGFDPPTSGSTGGDVNDHFVTVLHAIGLTAFDTFDPDRTGSPHVAGTTNDINHLLDNPTQLAHYQVLILPCGVLGNFTVSPNLTASRVTAIQNWLQAGGRLYSSDLAYEVIATPFPGAFTWAPGPSPHTGADPASCGVGIASGTTLPATVNDTNLASWLNLVAHTTGSTINVSELRDPWGAVDQIPATELSSTPPHAHLWVSGNVSWHVGTTSTVGPADHPLTAQADYPGTDLMYCGRVVFSSYHVQTAATATTLAPQERVLEYLFFQLTQCIGNLASM